MLGRIKKDIKVIFERDPAARSVIEVILCYPGLHAIWFHRISSYFYKRGWILLPRDNVLTERNCSFGKKNR